MHNICTCEPTVNENIMKLDPECKQHGYRVQGTGYRVQGTPAKVTTIPNIIERTKHTQFTQWFHAHLVPTPVYSDIYEAIEEIAQTAWKAGYEQGISDSRKQ